MGRRMAAIQIYSAFLLIFLSIAGQSDAAKDGGRLQDGPFSDFEKKYNRNLTWVGVNPGCNKDEWCKNSTDSSMGMISYARSKGPKDSLHHLFSTVGAPTLMISRTNVSDVKVNIDYEVLLNQTDQQYQAVNFTEEPDHSLGIIFSALYEYDDYNDTANMSMYHNNNTGPTVVRYNLTDLNWQIFNTNKDGDSTRTITVNATAPAHPKNGTHQLFKENGYLSFIVRYDAADGRLVSRPHMEHTANSSIVTVVMSNLTSRFAHSRFALEMIMFSTEKDTVEKQNSTQVKTYKSMDDEYSPGVFEMRNWFANYSKPRDSAWGYAQWKPVMYTSTQRKNADLSHATSYPNLPVNQKDLTDNYLPSRSLFKAYFLNTFDELSLNATNVSFGVTKDGFFASTDYLVWTMSVGMGPAPEDDVSLTVILVIAVGLGIPLVLMIFSVVFVCVKNLRRRNQISEYTAINE